MVLVVQPTGSGTGFAKSSPFRRFGWFWSVPPAGSGTEASKYATRASNAGRAPRILLSSSPPGDLGAPFWLGFGRLPTYRAESDRFEDKIWEGSRYPSYHLWM